jgi:hypothetical protein
MKYGPENVPIEKLPKTLFPGGMVLVLSRYNQDELEALASRPQVHAPMPEHWDDKKKRQLRGLAQFAGRTPEGLKKSLGNLPRKIKMDNLEPLNVGPDKVPTVSEGVMIPLPPTMVPKVPSKQTIQGKYLRRILSQEEARLFEETYVEWSSAHPEWDSPEDRDDLMTICLETVITYRLQAIERRNPTVDVGEKVNQSYRRKQNARDNLMARRKDKTLLKQAQSRNVLNVAVMAGDYSPEKLAEKQAQERVLALREEDEFLNQSTKETSKVEE